jgi:hypothetical protein
LQKPAAIFGSSFFLLLAPGIVAGMVPWWISRWEMRPPLLGFTSFSNCWGPVSCYGPADAAGFLRSFCHSGPGNSSPDFAHAAPGRDRTLSLCAEPHVRGRRSDNFRPRIAPGRSPPVRLRTFRLAGVLPLRLGIRRAQIEKDLRARIFGILQQRAAMDSATETLETAKLRTPRQAGADASSIAADNCSHAQATWSGEITAGGAIRIWSPQSPSAHP